MSEAQTDQEPTMEEILSSIRRIISEDEQEGEAGAVAQAPGPSVGSTESEQGEDLGYADVNQAVDLTDMVLDDGTVVELGPDGNPFSDSSGKGSGRSDDPGFQAKLDALGLVTSQHGKNKISGLLDSVTADTAAAAFAQLANTRAERSTTLEELVKELLRPMLKSWLDEHLSTVVERLVEREITKLSGPDDQT